MPFITISHHLAHAYSAVGTSPFETSNVMVIDGCGSPYAHCEDLDHAIIPQDVNAIPGLFGEKDSYYYFDGKQLIALYKDFSIISLYDNKYPVHLPTSKHSIGGFYSMVSGYCFGNMSFTFYYHLSFISEYSIISPFESIYPFLILVPLILATSSGGSW